MATIQNIFKVVSNEKLSQRFYRLAVDAKPILKSIQPGQFVHIRTSGGLEPFFRRPFSVFRAQKYLEIFYEAIGPGTKLMSQMKKGDAADVLGPLGSPFILPPKGTKQVVMIAGGIGVAPFLLLSDVLKKKDYDLVLLYGGRTKGHTFDMAEFKRNGCNIHVTTDDGSVGIKGRVSAVFPKVKWDPKTTFIYTCGPNALMAAVQKFAKQKNIKGQAACEEVMACALGACLGCSIQTTEGYKTVCYDGPCFDLGKIVFHA